MQKVATCNIQHCWELLALVEKTSQICKNGWVNLGHRRWMPHLPSYLHPLFYGMQMWHLPSFSPYVDLRFYKFAPFFRPVWPTMLRPFARGFILYAQRHGRKRRSRRLFLARLLFPLPFSQAEEARETRKDMEGKGVPRVSSSRVFCFHFLLAKRKRHRRRAKALKEKKSQGSLHRTSPVSITF